ncbi:MAG: EAL domain-containing protein [Gammaproteobacteria bacterium]|nr:EAL domain-containing protein [Gammaproteobacteria bacterium]
MKSQSILQIVLGLVIAVALVVFFINSQLDRTTHERTVTQLLTLLKLDERSDLQVAKLQTGLHQNYGELAENVRAIRTLYKELPEQHINSTTLLEELNKQFENKFKLIEFFKKDNAILKYTSRYIPKAMRDTRILINNSDTLGTDQKRRINKTLARLSPEISLFIAGQNDSKELILARIKTLKAIHFSNTASNQKIAIRDLIKHIEVITDKKSSVNHLVREIVNTPTDAIIKQLYQSHNQTFSALEKTAETYQQWLFITTFILLFYLSYIYMQLKKVSANLKVTLVDLDFHKIAIDKHAIVFTTDHKGVITYANNQFIKISQYSNRELVGSTLSILKSGLQDAGHFIKIWKTIASGKVWHGEIASRAKNGDIFWVDASIIPHLDSAGKPLQFTTIETDISDAKSAEKEMSVLEKLPDENPDPVLRIDSNGLILDGNTASEALLKHWSTAIKQSIPQDWNIICSRAIERGENETHEINIGKKHYSVIVEPLQSEQYINLYARDHAEGKVSDESFSHQATHDPSTGLTNRHAFELELENHLKSARHNNLEHILLYVDIDQFKAINNTCGHVAGDELLRQLSKTFTRLLSDNDILARLGDDEFGVLLTNCGIDKGTIIADKIRTTIKDFSFSWENKSFEVGARIAAILINQESENVGKILGHADIARYATKDGGDQVQVYHGKAEEAEQQQNELQWASEIPKALAENRFVLMGQIIIPLHPENDTNAHYEILIRLENDEGTLVPPGAFIPAAERYHFMSSIDLWVVTHVFETLTKHANDHPDIPLRVTINLSTDSLGNDDLLSYIASQIKLGKIPVGSVSFEVTETLAITNLSAAIDFSKKLKVLGCQFGLDAFGSNIASFTHFKKLAVDYLKIDAAFVKNILDDPIAEAMVIAINQISHVMGITTIGDFVEDKGIEKRLKDIGVDYAQGYGIEHPKRLDDIVKQLVRK